MTIALWFLFVFQLPILESIAQQSGDYLLEEKHPSLKIQSCKHGGQCFDKHASLSLDANLRPLQWIDGNESCYSDKAWNTSICSDSEHCAQDCALGGVKYREVHGVTTHDHSVKLRLFTHGELTESRVYLMKGEKHYKMFHLKNQEFSFEVNPSKVPCGVNAALYFTSMKSDGGLSSTNTAGAMYGTGYCDASCPTFMKFVDGKANIGSVQKPGDRIPTRLGACCAELDLWEGNSLVHAYTAHPCVYPSTFVCEGKTCKANSGLCDTTGCAFASQQWGEEDFYGANKAINTSSPFTIVTQFLTSNGTSQGDLVEIKQFYIQHGSVIHQPSVRFAENRSFDSLTDESCSSMGRVNFQKSVGEFEKLGGLASMGRAMADGMVLVMSLWTDQVSHTLGSIHKVPATRKFGSTALGQRLCTSASTAMPFIQKHHPDASVKFSNIKIGPINSTYSILPDSRPYAVNQRTII